MAAGLQITNTSGTVMIGNGFRHFRCAQKVTRQIPNGSSFTLNTSNTPVTYVQQDNGMFAPKTGKILNNALCFISNVSHGGAANFAQASAFGPVNVWGSIVVHAPAYAAGTLISVTYYVFDTNNPSAGGNSGLQVFNASGQLEFNSNEGLMQIRALVPIAPNDSWSTPIDSGRQWAALVVGKQYWAVAGTAYGPGIWNNGSRVGIRGIPVATGLYGSAGTRPYTTVALIDVTGL